MLDGLAVFGWIVFLDRVAWRSDPGYPDITAVHPEQRRVIWVELKTESGRLSPRQEDWRWVLESAGQEWYLWRPSSWASAERVMRGERLCSPANAPKEK